MDSSPMKTTLFLCGLLILAPAADGKKHNKSGFGLKNAVILVIRHGEKPASGPLLSPAGQARAQAYVGYFKSFAVGSKPLKLDYLFAAADSKESQRPRLTIEPLSKALGLAIDDKFSGTKPQDVVRAIRKKPAGQQFLICWHHAQVPQLLTTLGADPKGVLPKGKWPNSVFGWVIQLCYDSNSHLVEAKRIEENLMPDDADQGASKKR
jgi:hypothetical protein